MGVIHDMALAFFTALGVVVGGCFIGSIGSLITTGSPFHTMLVLAKPIKLWAVLAAIGGTFPMIQALDSGIWSGEIRVMLQHLSILISSLVGASTGYWLIFTLAGGE